MKRKKRVYIKFQKKYNLERKPLRRWVNSIENLKKAANKKTT